MTSLSDETDRKPRVSIRCRRDTSVGVQFSDRFGGERNRRTADRDLTVSAALRPGGHVGPTWTSRPWPHAVGAWCASATARPAAGEQMTSLAADGRYPRAGEQG
ncbi:DUF6228 family protein [Streptomyces sp. SID12488]|uniref:DUF6228 family protein n=1 Tax=Streptomyces sp. SID12488 TaxID=2706040 RepID=UPI0013DB9A28|nr:DUF6228 family protein [Streptomyces sp. SID12488]NEA63383.1 hypothetical protein [Streptomyces sp. SID12488]